MQRKHLLLFSIQSRGAVSHTETIIVQQNACASDGGNDEIHQEILNLVSTYQTTFILDQYTSRNAFTPNKLNVLKMSIGDIILYMHFVGVSISEVRLLLLQGMWSITTDGCNCFQ